MQRQQHLNTVALGITFGCFSAAVCFAAAFLYTQLGSAFSTRLLFCNCPSSRLAACTENSAQSCRIAQACSGACGGKWRVCEHAAAHCYHMASGATPIALRRLLPMSSHCEHVAAACCHMPAHGSRRPHMGRVRRTEAGPLVELALQGRQVVGGHGPQQHQQQAQCKPEHPRQLALPLHGSRLCARS